MWQQGEGFLGDGGKDQLALAAFGQHLAGVGIDDLGNEVVLVDVHTGLLAALESHARAGGLGQTVDIICLDAKLVLDVLTHILGPCFCTEDAGLQLDLVPDALFVDGFCQILGVAGGAAENGGAQIGHELQLTVGVAGAHGQGQAADLVAAAVKTRAAGEQTIAIGNVHNVFLSAAGGHDGTGAAVFPQVHVVLGVVGHHALAGGAGGGLDADTVLQGLAEKTIGISFSQIRLG